MIKSCKFMVRAYRHLFMSKQQLELHYWKDCHRNEGGRFNNDFYARLMLSIAGEEGDAFLKDKTVADFGCGPRGSLVWAKSAKLRIGIDVLAQKYVQSFPKDCLTHQMVYVTSTEWTIPIPDAMIDVLFTVNALDHVADIESVCSELRRIIKPGGLLIGSFNLNHRPTKAEPQTLTEIFLKEKLFSDFEILSWRVSAPGKPSQNENLYTPLYNNRPVNPSGKAAFLWTKIKKPE